jgi:hypothetical protein
MWQLFNSQLSLEWFESDLFSQDAHVNFSWSVGILSTFFFISPIDLNVGWQWPYSALTCHDPKEPVYS